jgi:GR25 family glycosyltransferase involved in LPS biosynthesis
MSQPCPIFVINLERSIDRLANMRLQLDRLGLTFDLVRAVKASANEAAGSRHNHFLGEYFTCLTPGEQACRESHLLALRAVANSHDRAVLVLEDDAEVGPAAVAALTDLCSMPGPLPECTSLYGTRSRGSTVAQLRSGGSLMLSVSPPIGAVAILWTPSGARKFLDVADQHASRPIDVQRKHWWEGTLHAAWISPPPITESTAFGRQSTIGARSARGFGASLAKWSYRMRFLVSSHCHFLALHGVKRWWKAQERVP